MEDMVSSWQGRRVFVTGHTGFKGGWLSLWLATLGAKVRGYALDPEGTQHLFSLISLGELIEDIRGDVRDLSSVQSAVSDFEPEVVFHLAAQPLVRRSYSDPLGTYATNVMGTANILEAVRTAKSVRAVVIVTTDKCYLNREWVWPYRETDPLGGFDPYASSKACAEIVTAAYRSSFFALGGLHDHGVAVATARAGNVIGGGDWSEDRLIPDLIRGFLRGEPVKIRRPDAIRPWQHVLEPLKGYLTLAERLLGGDPRFSDAFNFGPDFEDTWNVRQIADYLTDLWSGRASWTDDQAPSAYEAHYLRLDSSKARCELGWRPRLKIERALQWTIDWFRAWASGSDMRTKTLGQVWEYAALCNSPLQDQ
ncbi:CDP-glucose 4,6-dehydratase [Acidobacteria bacterium AB60]|nr:CDP-glucose 4,6-dehydratase [Acidobacteria bacterium AB60]